LATVTSQLWGHDAVVLGTVLLGHALVDRAVLVHHVVGAGVALRVAESDGPGPTSPCGLKFLGDGYCRLTKALQRDGWTVDYKRV
jgi:hypothetical protein